MALRRAYKNGVPSHGTAFYLYAFIEKARAVTMHAMPSLRIAPGFVEATVLMLDYAMFIFIFD